MEWREVKRNVVREGEEWEGNGGSRRRRTEERGGERDGEGKKKLRVSCSERKEAGMKEGDVIKRKGMAWGGWKGWRVIRGRGEGWQGGEGGKC